MLKIWGLRPKEVEDGSISMIRKGKSTLTLMCMAFLQVCFFSFGEGETTQSSLKQIEEGEKAVLLNELYEKLKSELKSIRELQIKESRGRITEFNKIQEILKSYDDKEQERLITLSDNIEKVRNELLSALERISANLDEVLKIIAEMKNESSLFLEKTSNSIYELAGLLKQNAEEYHKFKDEFLKEVELNRDEIKNLGDRLNELTISVSKNKELIYVFSGKIEEINDKIREVNTATGEMKISMAKSFEEIRNFLLSMRSFMMFIVPLLLITIGAIVLISYLKVYTLFTSFGDTFQEKVLGKYDRFLEMLDNLTVVLQELGTVKKEEEKTPHEVDHTWAIYIANEINNIERNISQMDPNTKGIKQINKSIEKLRNRLSSNGYEIVPLLGSTYHQGMSLNVVNFIEDENLKRGEAVITKVLIPQLNYNGKMIQQGHVEVSVGVGGDMEMGKEVNKEELYP
ncbi:MAG: hypothetical protein N3G21_08090 [Candidatus Hydrogenedentes bacterium]|nr:hypothetical protein [Candidatus Hydrogenedentota bacterium]